MWNKTQNGIKPFQTCFAVGNSCDLEINMMKIPCQNLFIIIYFFTFASYKAQTLETPSLNVTESYTVSVITDCVFLCFKKTTTASSNHLLFISLGLHYVEFPLYQSLRMSGYYRNL